MQFIIYHDNETCHDIKVDKVFPPAGQKKMNFVIMTMDDVIVSKKIKSFLPKDRKKEFCHYDNGLYRYDEEK